MNSDEIQKKMDFIIEQQAQFTVNVQKLEENLQRLEGSQENAEKRMSRLEGAIVSLVNIIGDSQKATDEKIKQVAETQSKALAETNERLNSLIIVVERFISGKNGSGHDRH